MELEYARELHNGDEVIWKETGEILTVVTVYTWEVAPEKYHCIEAMTSDGYRVLSHLDIE